MINDTNLPMKVIEPEETLKEIYKYFGGCQKAGHARMYKNVLPEANIVGLITTLLGNLYMPNGVTGEDVGNVLNSELECSSDISQMAYLSFKYYDLDTNKFNFSKETCSQIRKILKNIETIKYADSFGVDFHKTGYVNYIASMIVIKNRKDLNALKKEKKKQHHYFMMI